MRGAEIKKRVLSCATSFDCHTEALYCYSILLLLGWLAQQIPNEEEILQAASFYQEREIENEKEREMKVQHLMALSPSWLVDENRSSDPSNKYTETRLPVESAVESAVSPERIPDTFLLSILSSADLCLYRLVLLMHQVCSFYSHIFPCSFSTDFRHKTSLSGILSTASTSSSRLTLCLFLDNEKTINSHRWDGL